MTLRTLNRIRSKVNAAHSAAAKALRKSSDPGVAEAAADARSAAEAALKILDAEIEQRRRVYPRERAA